MTHVFRCFVSKDETAHEDGLAMRLYGLEFQQPEDHDLVQCPWQDCELVRAAIERVFTEAQSPETCSAACGGMLLGLELGLRTLEEQP